MDVAEAVSGLKQHFEQFVESAKAKLEQELPVLDAAASSLSGNPVVAALAAAVHLPQAPEILATIADMITKTEAALAAAHEAQQSAAPDVPAA